MRDRKFVVNLYQADDAAAMEKKLEQLAERGWLLERVTNWGWHLRRAEPQQVKYTVTYFPDASVFDSGVTAGQEVYADYCRAAGWEFVSAYGPIQYFRSARPDPVPIETDEGEKLRTIHKSMRKTLVFSHLLLLAAWLINLAMRLSDLYRDPISVLTDTRTLLTLLLQAGLVVYLSVVLIDYLIWYARSRRSVARGGGCLPPHTRLRLWAGAVLMVLACLALLAVIRDISSPGSALIFAYAFGGMILLIALAQGTLALLNRRGRCREQVRGLYIAAVIVLAVAYTAGMFPLGRYLYDAGLMDERQPVQTYTDSRGRTWDIYRDELPLTLEDLGYTVPEAGRYSYEAEEDRSLLGSSLRYRQRPASWSSSLPELEYQVVKLPGILLDFTMERLLAYYDECRPVEDPRWDARAVYRQTYSDGMTRSLVLWDDRILILHTDEPLTGSQTAAASAALRAVS